MTILTTPNMFTLPLVEELPAAPGCTERFNRPFDVLLVRQDFPSSSPQTIKVQKERTKQTNVLVSNRKCQSECWTVGGWTSGYCDCGNDLMKV